MSHLEVFFDFTCPYCYKGLKELADILEEFPGVTARWTPCEAHPRPEPAKVHSDVALRSCYVLADLLAKQGEPEEETARRLYTYIMNVYDAHFEKSRRIDDEEVLAGAAEKCGVSKDEFQSLLKGGAYADRPDHNNRLAWGELAFDAVPSYRYNGQTARSGGGLLVSKEKVRDLLK